MQAWIWTQAGEPTELELASVPTPTPGAGEVLVANSTIGLNPVDWKFIEWGSPDWRPGQIPGVDGVGQVVAVGAGVRRFKPGDRVAYHQSLKRPGSFASHALLAEAALLRVPAALSDEIAASFPCPGLTAWQALEKLPRRPGAAVMVTSAGGAVGGFVVQLAVRAGFRVIAVASTRHDERLRTWDAAEVIDAQAVGWAAELMARGLSVYAVIDAVSGAHAQALAPLVGANGHLVAIQDRLEAPPLPAFTTAISLHEVALNALHSWGSPTDWALTTAAGEALLEDLAAGRLQAPPLEVVDFSRLPLALAELKQGRRGKTVVKLG